MAADRKHDGNRNEVSGCDGIYTTPAAAKANSQLSKQDAYITAALLQLFTEERKPSQQPGNRNEDTGHEQEDTL
jgi:hypothetical protein